MDALPLPPISLRPGATELRDDDTYREDARSSVRELQLLAGLRKSSRVLDLGCGPGRLLIGLRAELGRVAGYTGVDVSRSAIDWATSHLREPWAEFRHVDIANERYNPEGQDSVVLPLPTGAYEVVALFSVFSHMLLADVVAHLVELERVMAAGGRIYLTAFVEDGVPDEEENPPGYLMDWKGRVHAVRFNRETFERCVLEAGLQVTTFLYRRHRGIQSVYVLSRRGDAGQPER